jgi:hypothetical protein
LPTERLRRHAPRLPMINLIEQREITQGQ